MTGLALPAVLLAGQRAVPSAPAGTVVFRDVAASSGLSFTHINGASPSKHIVETMGSGGLLFDYDGDGWLDVVLVDGGSVVDPRTAAQARTRLFRNRGDGTFADVTLVAKIEHRAYGMGACAADYDNDGHPDLYLTNFGPNVLYHNNGDGTFTDVTKTAGVVAPALSTSCAFADVDNDGWLDLFVVNYVDPEDNSKVCGDSLTGGWTSSSPTIWCRTSCFTTRGGVRSAKSACRPASRSRATAGRERGWAPTSAISTATGGSIWW